MSKGKPLDSGQARVIEEELYATLRKQVERNLPVPLPRVDFWENVSQLLDHIELELNELVSTEGHTLRAHTASRRQANVRRTLTELIRKRLSALLSYASTQSLRSTNSSTNNENKHKLAPIDWSRHDSAERQFFLSVNHLLDEFKQTISWNEMQNGQSHTSATPLAPLGSIQLDAYVNEPGGLTGQGPPSMIFENEIQKQPLQNEDDDEERIAKIEAFPEMMDDANRIIRDNPEHNVSSELSPELEEPIVINKKISASTVTTELYQPEKLVRIKITQSKEEPILTINGELDLQVGDIHMLENDTAEYLIEAGMAETAVL